MFRKLSFKYTVIFLLISLVPIVVVSIVSIKSAKNILKESIMENYTLLAHKMAESIDYMIQEKLADVEYLASTSEVRETLREANSTYLNETHEETSEKIHRLDEEWIAAKGATQTASRILGNDLSRFFKNFQGKYSEEIGEIFLTDSKGASVAMTKTLTDYFQADEMWWEESFNNGKGAVFLDDRGYDESIQGIAIGVVVPVRDGKQVVGILKVNLKVRGALDIAARSGTGISDIIFLFLGRSNGSYVTVSDENYDKMTELHKDLLLENLSGGKEDVHSGVKTIMAYAPVKVPLNTRVDSPRARKGISGEKWEPTQWMLFIEISQDKAFAPLRKLGHILQVMGLVIFVGVLLIALYVSRSITGPINDLIKGANILGKGNLDQRVQVNARDEIGELASALNKMAGDLKSATTSRDNLEKEIAERTRAEEELKTAYTDLKKTQYASLNIMADLDRQREKLNGSLREKEVLLSEIHHRVKNNMQIISSLLKLQSRHIKDKKFLQMFKDSESRIKSMALVHEKLYRATDLANINFADYTNNLVHDILKSFGIRTNKISLKLNVENICLAVDTAIPCGLILNELITNALKYAFPDDTKGNLRVEMRKVEGGGQRAEDRGQKTEVEDGSSQPATRNPQLETIELVVCDNGIGIPKDLNLQEVKSLGLSLVNTLVRQIRGEIELKRENGTEWKIRFGLRTGD